MIREKPIRLTFEYIGSCRKMKSFIALDGTQKSAAAELAAISDSDWLDRVPDSKSSITILDFPSSRKACSISWRRLNQNLSMKSPFKVSPITGDFTSLVQKHTPSIFELGIGSTITNRTPQLARIRGTCLISSGSVINPSKTGRASRSALLEYF